ncbi:hypothetical protein BHE74_00053642 [Ensete ventricosum]|nr:hypothetical protein GW17_00012110 [Ensete ventricosum]RWW40911.1 hypothetical protein BHE74_00053642 [Ensete ventricosum]RZR96782.1 hypothetical protein BHM03_00025846 [Ensete ventricosum]
MPGVPREPGRGRDASGRREGRAVGGGEKVVAVAGSRERVAFLARYAIPRAINYLVFSTAEVVTGSTAWIGRGLACVCAQRRENDGRLLLNLTPSQEECLRRLQSRTVIAYDSSKKEHQEALWALWYYAYPGVELRGLVSNQWKEMGWQGKDPSTDFRYRYLFSLQKSFQALLRKQEGVRAMWEYPFSVAGVNITFMLIQMFDLQAGLYSLDCNKLMKAF